jgi:putative salt-induced outer membrane protein
MEGGRGRPLARGNSDTDTVNLKLDMSTERDPWKHSFGIAALRASDQGDLTAERYAAFGQSDYKLTDHSYWFGGLRYEKDTFGGFDYQASAHRLRPQVHRHRIRSFWPGRRRLPSQQNAVMRPTAGHRRSPSTSTPSTRARSSSNGCCRDWFQLRQQRTGAQVKMSDRLALSAGLAMRHNTDPRRSQKNTLTTERRRRP